MDVDVFVVILCASGFWNVQIVTAESVDLVNIVHDIRNELNNLKLSNELHDRKIMRLERQVGECHANYAELEKQTSSVTRIEKRLADVELKLETNHHELIKRLKAVEMLRSFEQGHKSMDDRGAVEEDVVQVKNFDAAKGKTERERAGTKERQSHRHNRIVPVTSSPVSKTRIAFSTYSTQIQNHVGFHRLHIRNEQTVHFEDILTNEGLAFNPTAHAFICPVSGMYYFTNNVAESSVFEYTSIASGQSRSDEKILRTEIVKHGAVLAKTNSYIATKNSVVPPNSNAVVAVCNQGEAVWVRLCLINMATLRLEFRGRSATFTGFLLWTL